MIRITAIFILAVLGSDAGATDFTRQIGIWRFDEQLTRESIKASTSLPAEEKNRLFLQVAIRAKTLDSYIFKKDVVATFGGEKPSSFTAYLPYKVLSVLDADTVKLQVHYPSTGKSSESILTFERQCFYVADKVDETLPYKSYYCRIDE